MNYYDDPVEVTNNDCYAVIIQIYGRRRIGNTNIYKDNLCCGNPIKYLFSIYIYSWEWRVIPGFALEVPEFY